MEMISTLLMESLTPDHKVTVTEKSSNKTGTATCTVAPYNLSKVNILIDNQKQDPAAMRHLQLWERGKLRLFRKQDNRY